MTVIYWKHVIQQIPYAFHEIFNILHGTFYHLNNTIGIQLQKFSSRLKKKTKRSFVTPTQLYKFFKLRILIHIAVSDVTKRLCVQSEKRPSRYAGNVSQCNIYEAFIPTSISKILIALKMAITILTRRYFPVPCTL